MSTVESKNIGKVVLDVKNISLSFGGVKALTDISFDVREHEVRAIIGPNGAGKSSMPNGLRKACIRILDLMRRLRPVIRFSITFMPLNSARF